MLTARLDTDPQNWEEALSRETLINLKHLMKICNLMYIIFAVSN